MLSFRRSTRTSVKPLVSVEEAATSWAEPLSLYRAIKIGSVPLPVLTIGRRYRIPRAAVERLINGDSPSSTSS